MWSRSSTFVVTTIALLFLAGSSFALAGADRTTAPPKQPPSRLLYTLSVEIVGHYSLTEQAAPIQGVKLTGNGRSTSVFTGRSSRFWLIRSGTASKPSYTLASSGGTPLYLWVTGAVDATGTGQFSYPAAPDQGLPQACSWDETATLVGDTDANVDITLSKNRLSVGSVDMPGTYHLRWHVSDRCAYLGSVPPPSGVPPTGLSLPSFPIGRVQTLGSSSLKQVSFGHPFKLVWQRSGLIFPNDPSLHEKHTWPGGGSSEEIWEYIWRLTFTLA
jgi:hypothetical protein